MKKKAKTHPTYRGRLLILLQLEFIYRLTVFLHKTHRFVRSRRRNDVGRIGRGWELTKMNLRVIRKDKRLLVFPLISGLVLIAILASFVGLWFVSIEFDLSNLQFGWTFAVFWIAFYFVAFFVLIFFSVALTSSNL